MVNALSGVVVRNLKKGFLTEEKSPSHLAGDAFAEGAVAIARDDRCRHVPGDHQGHQNAFVFETKIEGKKRRKGGRKKGRKK